MSGSHWFRKNLKIGKNLGNQNRKDEGTTQATQTQSGHDLWYLIFQYFQDNDTLFIALAITIPIANTFLCAILSLAKASITVFTWPFRLLFTCIEYLLRTLASGILYIVRCCQWCRKVSRNEPQNANDHEMRPLNQSNQPLSQAQGGNANNAVSRIETQLRPAITFNEDL